MDTQIANESVRKSLFNVQISTIDGDYLLFNGATLAMLVVPKDMWSEAKALLSSTSTSMPKSTIGRMLKEGGFLVHSERNELWERAAIEEAEATDKSKLQLYLFPTMGCNMDCPYCFVKKEGLAFSKEVQNALLDFISKRSDGLKHLTLVWYGGEPLLAKKMLLDLSGRIRAAVPNVFIKQGIYTNGYLLNRETALHLRSAGIDQVHIPFDGDKDLHDSRRKLMMDGSPTLEKILDNIAAIEGIFSKIELRLHVDRESIPSVSSLLQRLHDRGFQRRKDISVYFAPMEAETPTCRTFSQICFTTRDYAKLEVAFALEAMQLGFETLQYPAVAQTHCLARTDNQFAIGPDGSIFKCVSDIGYSDKAAGHLMREQTEAQAHMEAKYRNDTFMKKQNCVNCKVLPQCMGGCSYKSQQHTDGRLGVNIALKFNIKQSLAIQHQLRRADEGAAREPYFLVPPQAAAANLIPVTAAE